MKSDAQEEFLARYEKEKPMFKAWGDYVLKYIYDELNKLELDIAKIIKIKVEPRVKEINSILEKAFFREGKNYKNAYEEITDKVGIRFVVMVDKQINIIKNIIEYTDVWSYSKDQDYEEAIYNNPDIFGYQSVHYVVKNVHTIEYNGIDINSNTPCEIQIRTLEQHAYAELSHDYVYKSKDVIQAEIKRYLARSMALNETTDELFSKVYDMMEDEDRKYEVLNQYLKSKYNFLHYNCKINKDIYECLKSMIDNYSIDEECIDKFLNNYYLKKIDIRQNKILYQQPMIIIIYYLAKKHAAELQEKWKFTQDMLVMVFSDLGIQSDDFY